MQWLAIRGTLAFVVQTQRAIEIDEEILVSYGSDYFDEDHPCSCKSCKPPQAPAISIPKRRLTDNEKKIKRKQRKLHQRQGTSYGCGDGGEAQSGDK